MRSTSLGIPVLLCALVGCTTYSDGSMAAHESVPHSHLAPGADGLAMPHSHTAAGDGLSASLHGYSLEAVTVTPVGGGTHLSFRVRGPSGAPQLQYSLDHEKLLHLYVVSEDLATYHHEHPVLDSSGTWQVDLPVLDPGTQHVVASFVAIDDTATEHALVLGTDVLVEGAPVRRPLPPPAETVEVDGVTVRLAGDPVAGRPSRLVLTASRGGAPAALVPYLSAWAHVTAVHLGSRALVHLHPSGLALPGDPAPRSVPLTLETARPGRYRLFVDFATEDGVRRAEFTRDVR